jgi:hypothetical protein
MNAIPNNIFHFLFKSIILTGKLSDAMLIWKLLNTDRLQNKPKTKVFISTDRYETSGKNQPWVTDDYLKHTIILNKNILPCLFQNYVICLYNDSWLCHPSWNLTLSSFLTKIMLNGWTWQISLYCKTAFIHRCQISRLNQIHNLTIPNSIYSSLNDNLNFNKVMNYIKQDLNKTCTWICM